MSRQLKRGNSLPKIVPPPPPPPKSGDFNMSKKPKTVWVVEQGQYSDYHVVGVFTSKESRLHE